ncbi:MAG TPA: hypothetical protein VJO12_03125 [Stellaceae bacterium]|nr:hypothetical protein [Stellaceae bacterium]
MALHLAIALMGATLIGSPDSGTTMPPEGTPATKAETFAAAAGHVLGAASACDKIDQDRLDSAAHQVGETVQGEVDDDDELTSAHAMFVDSVAAGRRSIASGDLDCDAAAAKLADLERSIRH